MLQYIHALCTYPRVNTIGISALRLLIPHTHAHTHTHTHKHTHTNTHTHTVHSDYSSHTSTHTHIQTHTHAGRFKLRPLALAACARTPGSPKRAASLQPDRL